MKAHLSGEVIEGYASLFGVPDAAGDRVAPGAFAASLIRRGARGVKMLYQHRAAEPIGVWERIIEDRAGLYVRGRVVPEVIRARETLALVRAGALDGLSIGFRTRRARRDREGGRELLEVDLHEISLVTFPLLPGARARVPPAPSDAAALLRAAAHHFSSAHPA
jgi:HK97 family phage prohead protease